MWCFSRKVGILLGGVSDSVKNWWGLLGGGDVTDLAMSISV